MPQRSSPSSTDNRGPCAGVIASGSTASARPTAWTGDIIASKLGCRSWHHMSCSGTHGRPHASEGLENFGGLSHADGHRLRDRVLPGWTTTRSAREAEPLRRNGGIQFDADTRRTSSSTSPEHGLLPALEELEYLVEEGLLRGPDPGQVLPGFVKSAFKSRLRFYKFRFRDLPGR